MQEATDIMQKMKNMPGMSSIQSMMSKMGMDIGSMAGMAGMGNSKVNTSAMAAQLERNLKAAKQKDRLRAKMVATQLAKSQAAAAAAAAQTNPSLKTVNSVNGVENLVFSKGEKVDRSSVQDQQQQQPSQSQVKKNKKKNKNKK
jgi:precorrin-6B methylase 1